MFKRAFFAGVALCAAVPAFATVTVTYESPTAVNTTLTGSFVVEDFEHDATGFNRDFADTITNVSGRSVTFSYNDVAVRAHDQFGGLGAGNYGATYNGIGFDQHEGPTFSLDVSSTSGDINYFGAYFSATDFTNTITFSKNGSEVQSFTLGQLWAGTTGLGDQGSRFINFAFSDGATYDRIVFNQPNSPFGFESDNHTVGSLHLDGDDTAVVAVPEAATWAMMLGGFGLIGAALRRRRTSLTFA